MKRKDGNVMNVIRDRLDALRKLMKERGMDAYMIPTADFHESEYVGEHFKCREYMTGFTGSAGRSMPLGRRALLCTGSGPVKGFHSDHDENGAGGRPLTESISGR